MAKHEKDRGKKHQGKAFDPARPDNADQHGGGHTPAKAHGRPATVDTSLPGTREELIERHAEVRRKRAAAPLLSDAYQAAADEIGRIEVRIAAVERAMTPPKG